MNHFLRYKGWFLLSLFVLICLIGLAWRSVWGLYYQHQAGKLLDRATFLSSVEKDPFACRGNEPQNAKSQKLALQAISLLNETKQLMPNQAYADFLLGKAYCISRNYHKAIEALDAFTKKRPNYFLGYIELGFAHNNHFQMLRKSEKSGRKNTHRDFDRYAQRIKEVWQKAQLNDQVFLGLGDNALNSGKYREALSWYRTADVIQPLKADRIFRAGIIELALKIPPFFSEDVYSGISVIKLQQKVVIPAISMYSFSAGKPILIQNQDNAETGILADSLDQAIVLIDFPASQEYCFSIRALDLPPKPTMLELNLDLSPSVSFELAHGDQTWSDFTYRIPIEQGVHVIGIRLMNDGIENGLDRNGYIHSLSAGICGE